MTINILTLFPDMFRALNESIIGKAQDKNIIKINIFNIRDYSKDKHKKCDDTTFGGGAGLLMTAQPIYDAVLAADPKNLCRRVYMSPTGRVLNQSLVTEFSKDKDLLILCGHYEGVDQRVIDICGFEEISIGDYVLTGGELPAMVLIDCISRYIPNVLHSTDSVIDESFAGGLLEYPQYTKPYEFMGKKVPDVLISGHHENIKKWRKDMSLKVTKEKRPDLLKED